MAANSPVSLDPFTQITNIQFGSNWLVVLATFGGDVSQLQFVTCVVDFVGIAGGTPGYFLLPVDAEPSRSFPYTIQAADLSNPNPTDAGAHLIGFPIAPVGDFAAADYVALTGMLAGDPFKVRFVIDNNATQSASLKATMQVWTLTAAQMKVGSVQDGSSQPPAQSVVSVNVSGEGVNGNFDFLVNPQTLKVTAA